MGTVWGSRVPLVKDWKRVKKLGVRGLQTGLGLEATKLAVDSLLLLVSLQTHI